MPLLMRTPTRRPVVTITRPVLRSAVFLHRMDRSSRSESQLLAGNHAARAACRATSLLRVADNSAPPDHDHAERCPSTGGGNYAPAAHGRRLVVLERHDSTMLASSMSSSSGCQRRSLRPLATSPSPIQHSASAHAPPSPAAVGDIARIPSSIGRSGDGRTILLRHDGCATLVPCHYWAGLEGKVPIWR